MCWLEPRMALLWRRSTLCTTDGKPSIGQKFKFGTKCRQSFLEIKPLKCELQFSPTLVFVKMFYDLGLKNFLNQYRISKKIRKI